MGNASYTPYALLSYSNGKDKDNFYIRFSPVATRVIGARVVDVKKTDNNKYIILVPQRNGEPLPGMSSLKVYHGSAYLFCTGRVNQRFFRRDWFDKRRCKIKRKSEDGSIWICLEERIDDGEGRTDSED